MSISRSRSRVFVLFALVGLLSLASVAHAHNEWHFASEFRTSPNQANPSPDHDNNAGVWRYMQGPTSGTPRNPATYSLLGDFTALCLGVEGWYASSTLYPRIYKNVGTASTVCDTVALPPARWHCCPA